MILSATAKYGGSFMWLAKYASSSFMVKNEYMLQFEFERSKMIIAIDIKYIYKFEQEGKFEKGASFKQ